MAARVGGAAPAGRAHARANAPQRFAVLVADRPIALMSTTGLPRPVDLGKGPHRRRGRRDRRIGTRSPSLAFPFSGGALHHAACALPFLPSSRSLRRSPVVSMSKRRRPRRRERLHGILRRRASPAEASRASSATADFVARRSCGRAPVIRGPREWSTNSGDASRRTRIERPE